MKAHSRSSARCPGHNILLFWIFLVTRSIDGLVRETAVSALNQRFLNFNYVYIAFLGLKRLLKNPLSIPLLSAFCIIYLFIYFEFLWNKWVSMGWLLLRLTVPILASLRLTVNVIPLLSPEIVLSRLTFSLPEHGYSVNLSETFKYAQILTPQRQETDSL